MENNFRERFKYSIIPKFEVDHRAVGEMCLSVVPPWSGSYYIAAVTQDTNVNELNDMLMKVHWGLIAARGYCRRPLADPYEMFMNYQKFGKEMEECIVITANHKLHLIVSIPVLAGKVYELFVSWRSIKCKINDLVMVCCEKENRCGPKPKFIQEDVKFRRPAVFKWLLSSFLLPFPTSSTVFIFFFLLCFFNDNKNPTCQNWSINYFTNIGLLLFASYFLHLW